jgi:hypothetical protein
MLAQFQERYPAASLLSQLLTIYQGKFVVQVSVKIEGVVRATGMAAAETIELAEDQARLRAISLVATQEITPSVPPRSDRITSIPESANLITTEVSSPPERSAVPTVSPSKDDPEFTAKNSKDYLSLIATDADSITDEDFGMDPIAPVSNVTPFVLRTAPEELPLLDPINSELTPAVIEPVDLSDTLAAITKELKNLGWTAKQERNYIDRIYNKESCDFLSPQQLYEFLNYLEVFGQTSKELARLGWDNQQGQDYLMQNYKKRSRQYLNYQELKDFLQRLQVMS